MKKYVVRSHRLPVRPADSRTISFLDTGQTDYSTMDGRWCQSTFFIRSFVVYLYIGWQKSVFVILVVVIPFVSVSIISNNLSLSLENPNQ
jgi:hypothetical protein